jgi:hypothetical protein
MPQPIKPHAGAPLGNQNASKTGLHSAKVATTRFGQRAINKRTRAGVEWKGFYIVFLSMATGIGEAELTRGKQIREASKRLSKVEIAEIEALATELWFVRKLDAEIIQMKSITRRREKERATIPLLAERDARLNSYERRRAAFVERYKGVTPDLQTYMASKKRGGA